MTYQEEKQVKLRRQGSKHAIALAMQSRWQEAIEVNKNLIGNFPQDAEAYNRLGKAFIELGDYVQAETAYKRAVELDPFNVIAKKNLSRLPHLIRAMANLPSEARKAEPQHFIEETGKARLLNLYRPAAGDKLATILAGDTLNLRVEGSTVVVEDTHGTYLGMIEPKHGHRLVELMKGGNRYSAAVVSSSNASASIIVKEIYQDPSQVGIFSFPGRRYEDVALYSSDKIFKDSTEYGAAGDFIVEGEAIEARDDSEDTGEEKPEHDI